MLSFDFIPFTVSSEKKIFEYLSKIYALYITETRYTASIIVRNVAFILDAPGTASFIVNIMEKQTEGGGKCGENSEKKESV